ncbi:MAG: polysulfide reductase NrfD [Deltaproteobacteria bacterium]|nr:polysulfide reductase NrfD [Deltaproteobacteria bacterium]
MERIDELLVGVKPQREWGLLVVIYLFLGGAGAGLYAVSLFMGKPLEAALGLVVVAVGTAFLLLDLGRPERFWRAFMRPGTSWISRGTFFIALLMIAGTLQVAPSIPGLGFLPWKEGTTIGWLLKAASALLAVLVMTYTGFVLSPSPAVPFWYSPLVPAVFLGYSLLAGVDLFLLIERIIGHVGGNLMFLEWFQGHLTIACLALVVLHIAVMSSRSVAAREAVRMLTRSRHAVLFAGGVIFVGLVAPLILTGSLLLNRNAEVAVPSLALAGAMRLSGDYLFRYLMVKTGCYDSIL